MTPVDLLVRGGTLAGETSPGDIAIVDGEIAAIGPSLPGDAASEIDATGLMILPGGVDPHVHFNEPGARTEWEGFATGSAAAAAGGITTVIEMPLNASPPTVDAAAFDAKRAAAERSSHVDFGLWGGVIPGNLAQLAPLAQRGVVGFKAFMSASGVADFPACDDLTLYEAMVEIAALGLPLAVHAESDTITRRLAERAQARGEGTVRDYLRSRPVIAETEAIARVIELASTAGCPLHVVHVSSGRGVALVAQARLAGADVSCEVTPHHLLLTEDDAERLGAVAKCAPPLRPAAETERLWQALGARDVEILASDHSPSPPELKQGDDAFAVWGGISGVQSTLELLLTDGRLPAARIPDSTAGAAARRLRLPGKGALQLGMDADLVAVSLGEERVLPAQELRYRHPHSPYVGRTLSARVACTVLRGEVVYRAGAIVGPPRGRLITPSQNPSR